MIYLLDTDVLSQLMRKRAHAGLLARLRRQPAQALCTTAVNVMELRHGSARRDDHASFWPRIEELILSRVRILAFDEVAARLAGDLRAELERLGTPIGTADVQIAAVALANRATLVTHNTRHFGRVPGLEVQDWLAEASG